MSKAIMIEEATKAIEGLKTEIMNASPAMHGTEWMTDRIEAFTYYQNVLIKLGALAPQG